MTTLVPTTPSPRMLVRWRNTGPWPDHEPDAETAALLAALAEVPVVCRWSQLDPLWRYRAVSLAEQARHQAIVRGGAVVRLTGPVDDVRGLLEPIVTIDRWFNTPAALGIEQFSRDVEFYRAA